MADDIVQVAPDGTGKKIDNSSLTVSGQTVYRQRMNLSDPTDPTALVAVKNASTAALSTDPALVVTPSPNGVQQIAAYKPTSSSGSITAATTTIGPLTTAALSVVTVAVYGTYSAVSFTFQGSFDNANWFPVAGSRSDTGQITTGLTLGSNLVVAWDITIGTFNYFRVQATAWTSGSASVVITGQSLPYDSAPSVSTQGLVAGGSALPTSPNVAPVIIGGGSIAGGTNATIATVKAGSTAVASTDTALGVGLHPSSPLPAGTNALGSVTLGAGSNAIGSVTLGAGSNTIGTVNVSTATLPAAAANADGVNPTISQIGADGYLFNGSTWDRNRNNLNTTTGDSGAKTATFNGATVTNYNARGAFITAVISTVSGTSPTLTFVLQMSYDGGTNWINLGPTSSALTAAGSIQFYIYPTNFTGAGSSPATMTTGATIFTPLNASLPRTWRLVGGVGGTSPSFTITGIYVNYLL